MVWSNLSAQVAEEFYEAQEPLARRLQMAGWKHHSEYVKRTREAKRRYTLRQLRVRLQKRAVICCANPKCKAEFVPYWSTTRYCTVACRIRHLSLEAYFRRRNRQRATIGTRCCKVCSKPVSRRRVDAIYCSVKCNRVALRRRAKLAEARHA